jgi:predicted nuclease of restriction endonuclease-like RecB superfamily
MRKRGIGWGLAVLALGAAGSLSMARAQAAGTGMPEGLPLPPAVEKELAAKAIDMTEVTLGKNMLDFAAKFMKDKDDEQARKLIQGLKGIYVRNYTFEKEGDYSMDQIKQLRAYFETSEWSPIVHSVERRKGEMTETTDVLVKTVNGETQGMFILSAEPKELSIVLILGPINVEDLAELHGIGGLHVLKDVEKSTKKAVKERDKGKDGGGAQ